MFLGTLECEKSSYGRHSKFRVQSLASEWYGEAIWNWIKDTAGWIWDIIEDPVKTIMSMFGLDEEEGLKHVPLSL